MPQPVEIDIGAAVDRDKRFAGDIMLRDVFLEPRDRQRAGRLRDHPRVVEDILHRRTDLVDRGQHHVVDKFADETEWLSADLRHGDAVGEDADLLERNQLIAFQRPGHGRRVFRFDADHLDFRPHGLHVSRDTGDQAAAADGHEDRVDVVGALPQDFHPDGTLPRDDVGVVERMDVGQPFGLRDFQRAFIGFLVVVAMQNDARRPVADGFHLDVGGRLRHDDSHRNTQLFGCQRHALRMIAGRRGDNAARLLLFRQMQHLVVGASQFERENRLQILALDQHIVVEARGQGRRRLQRRFRRNVVDARVQDLVQIVFRHNPLPPSTGRAGHNKVRSIGPARKI